MILNDIRITDEKGDAVRFYTDNNALIIKKNDVPNGCLSLLFDIPALRATCGDDGYYAISDVNNRGSHLAFFGEKPDYDVSYYQILMPIFGVKNKNGVFLGVASGMKYSFYVNTGVKNGHYYLRPKFVLDGDMPYEDVRLELYELPSNAEYADMAAKYRELQLKNGACLPLKERIRENPELDYIASSVEIRIRMGWKPAPPKVLEQTLENEPPMKVACTFDRVRELVDELKKQGVEKAQICLVGWNKSGHDGRYPDLFPVEEKLGGEAKLRELILHAQKNGYKIVCHTNSSDCYHISKEFGDGILTFGKDGKPKMSPIPWSGGNMYWLCPAAALRFAKRDLPKVAELGFSGTHYIDVMTVNPPRACYDKEHPVNLKECVEYYNEIMKLSHENFGGFASEGCFDFAAKYLDYGLYVSWGGCDDCFFDREIPFWQLVYHGIILSNPGTATVNYPIKGADAEKKAREYGARPSFYFYSKFLEGSNMDNWLGSDDMMMDTDEQLIYNVSKIKEAYDSFKKEAHLQKEYIVGHEYLSENLRKTTYSDGTVITLDYGDIT